MIKQNPVPSLAVRTALAAAIAVALGVAPAGAQSSGGDTDTPDQNEERRAGPPVRIVPGEDGRPAGESERNQSGRRANGEEAREDRRPAVRREELGPPDLEATGFLSAEQGGFGIDLWRNTSRPAVESLLPRLPDRSPSIVVRDLTRRLLATPAEPPSGPAGADLLGHRAERLLAMGRLEDVLRLLDGVDRDGASPVRRRAELEALFLLRGAAGACPVLGEYARGETTAFLERALIVCSALSNQHDEADLGVRLLIEQNADPSPAFVTLVNAQRPMSDAAVDTLSEPNALTTTLLLATNLPLPGDFVTAGHPAYLLAAALSENGPLSRRLRAAERAGALGALDPERIAAMYREVSLRPALYAAATRIEPSRYDLTRRILMYQAARNRTAGAPRLEALRHWWHLGSAAGDPGHAALVSLVSMPLIEETVPDPAFAPYAEAAGRAAYRAQDTALGFAWYQVLANADLRDSTGLARLAALARLAGQPAQFGPAELDGWAAHAQQQHGEDAASRILYLYALMDGLGDAEVQRAMWQPHLADIQVDQRLGLAEANLADMIAAAESGQRGLALLLVLSTIGNRSFAEIPAGSVRVMILTLRRAGLDEDARALAVEAALMRGL